MRAVGIDLTQSNKPCSIAALEENRLFLLQDISDDDEIFTLVGELEPDVIALDSPLFLPKGMCCLEEACGCVSGNSHKGRVCEVMLSRRGIGSYYTTKKSIIKPMIYRAIRLKNWWQDAGLEVIEIYPYATTKILFGQLPKKTTKQGFAALRDRLRSLVLGVWVARTHDHLDAILGAYTGYLYLTNRAGAIGDAEEGLLWIPSHWQGEELGSHNQSKANQT